MIPERMEEICRLVCEEVEKAGSGGFAALAHLNINPIYSHRKGRPIGLRMYSRMGHLVEAISVPKSELVEFCNTITPEMLERVKVAGKMWLEKMKSVWAEESEARIEAETV